MIPVNLKLQNFSSYGTEVPELSFEGFRLACLSGNNGVGKSSLLDSITWVLWGWSRTGDNSDRLVKLGSKEMWVEFEFELEGNIFKVRRSRKLVGNGQTTLELFSKGKESWFNLTEGTIKATQEKIHSILKLTYDTFINSSYLKQGRADEFTLKRPNERKEILANILGLDEYERWEEKAKEKARDINNKLSSLEYSLVEIDKELLQKETSKTSLKEAELKVLQSTEERKKVLLEKDELVKKREELLIIEQNYTKLKEMLDTAQKELDEIVSQGRTRGERIKLLQEKIDKAGEIEKELAQLADLEKKDKELSDLQTQVMQLTTQKEGLLTKVAENKKEQSLLEQQIENLNKKIEVVKTNDKCPTCGNSLEGGHKKQAMDEIRQEIDQKQSAIDSLGQESEKRLKEIEDKITAISYNALEHKEIRNKISSLEGAKKEQEQITANKASLEVENRTKLELAELYKNKKKQVDETTLLLQSTPTVAAELQSLNLQFRQKEAELSAMERIENEARDLYGQAKKLVERLELMEKNREERVKEKNLLTQEKGIYDELSLAFSKRGIQAMLIEAAIPEIEEETNKLLERLTDGRMKVAFETQRENKSGGIVETLDIIISDEQGERPYETYSGGEAFRVNFAIRLAISKLLTHRAGAKLQFLIIDEGFGTQDNQGRDRLVEAINLIKDDFAKVMVVTHIEELKSAFSNRIEVSKNNSGSTFQLIES